MNAPGGGTEGQQLAWVNGVHTSANYQHHIQGSVSGSSIVISPSAECMPTQYTSLSALQGSFVAVQPTAEYQSLQGNVGYQPVYISGSNFEGISSDGDFVVAAADDGVQSSLQVLNTRQPAVQVWWHLLSIDYFQFIFLTGQLNCVARWCSG